MSQPVMITSNPFRDAYDALWTMLRSKVDFNSLFGDQTCFRQISVNATPYWSSDNDLDHASLGAHPRVRVVATKLDPATERDSCGSQAVLTLEIKIWTAAQQQGLILDCVWTVLRGMIGWREYVRDVVTWNGLPCVIDVDARALDLVKPPLAAATVGHDKVDSRGYNQWIGIWATELTFSFRSLDMKNI